MTMTTKTPIMSRTIEMCVCVSYAVHKINGKLLKQNRHSIEIVDGLRCVEFNFFHKVSYNLFFFFALKHDVHLIIEEFFFFVEYMQMHRLYCLKRIETKKEITNKPQRDTMLMFISTSISCPHSNI